MIFMNSGADQAIGIDNTQAGWLQQRLHELTNGWSAIVLQHIVFQGVTVASGETVLPIVSTGTTTKNMIDSQYSHMEDSGVGFVGLVSGHTHRDYNVVAENGYPIIATTCDANGAQASTYDDANPTRTSGTTTEQAFDVYHVDTSAKKIYITRIGAGSDREFAY